MIGSWVVALSLYTFGDVCLYVLPDPYNLSCDVKGAMTYSFSRTMANNRSVNIYVPGMEFRSVSFLLDAAHICVVFKWTGRVGDTRIS